MAAPLELMPQDEHARRLLRTAAKHSLDPEVEIDWDAPIDPDMFWMPPERCTLYDTQVWHSLTHRQRVELTKHEACSIASAGVWFELVLMNMLMRHLYDRSKTDEHARFTYTEVLEECRHSMMFGKMVSKAGCPDYPRPRLIHEFSRFYKTVANTTQIFAGALFIEEILDYAQREALADERVQPLARAVSRLHVVEEARHIKFAKMELKRSVPDVNPIRLRQIQMGLPIMSAMSVNNLINPNVYRSIGLEPKQGRAIAKANPHWQKMRRELTEGVILFYHEVGLIPDWLRKTTWKATGLLPAELA